jgi:hypothetical protein
MAAVARRVESPSLLVVLSAQAKNLKSVQSCDEGLIPDFRLVGAPSYRLGMIPVGE